MLNLKLKPEFVYPLLLQRSRLRNKILRNIRKVFNKLNLISVYDTYIDRTIIKRIEQLRVKKIEILYLDAMKKQFSEVEHHLPVNCKSFVEIGPGLGGFSLLCAQYYPESNITLIDRNGISDQNSIGFHTSANDFSHYCEFNHVEEFLGINGVNMDKVKLVDISRNLFPAGNYDLIFSFLAWGYHFPVETYLKEVSRNISQDGCLIIDIREGTNGKASLSSVFKSVICIENQSNFKRYKCSVINNEGLT